MSVLRQFNEAASGDLSEKIRYCYEHADDCARHAKAQADLRVRQGWLVAERRWLMLARRYEHANSVAVVTRSGSVIKKSTDV